MPLQHLDDIDEFDLSEAPRLPKDPQSRGAMIGLVLAVALLAALLFYGSMPELSPEEIVAMEGYEGEQETKFIFNIHSLEKNSEEAVSAASEESGDQIPPLAVTEPVEPVESSSNSVSPVALEVPEVVSEQEQVSEPNPEPEQVAEQELPIAQTETIVVASIEPQVTDPVSQTLPVVVTESVSAPVTEATTTRSISFSTARDEKVVAAMATTPVIEEAADTVVIASVVAAEPIPVPVLNSTLQSAGSTENSRAKLLPLRSVLQDATELKASPSAQAETLLSLRRGVTVTAFERYGEWIHIGINDGSSVTGYILESRLGR